MSLKGKLNRFKSHLTVENQHKPAGNQEEAQPSESIPYLDRWQKLQATPFFYEDQAVITREVRYPIDSQHGRYKLAQLYDVVDMWNSCQRNHPLSCKGIAASDLLFFDTETTGLHGGAGNTIFLLGYSRVHEDHVTVRQYFLPGPESETAFYQGFLQDVREMKNLVTFNGKAFDWPQVKTRHTLNRNSLPDLPAFGHFDLLHGARRLWKDQLPSCRLAVIEDEILDIPRSGDTPGYLAPLLYFDFLKEKNPDIVQGILQHNEQDILTLILLYIHLSLLLFNSGTAATDKELLEIGRWYDQLGEWDAALQVYSQIQEGNSRERTAADLATASIFKKLKNIEAAVEIWEGLVHRLSVPAPDIYTELAKAYEHHYKDFDKSLYYAERAYAVWKSAGRTVRMRVEEERQAYLKRIHRLNGKICM